MKYPSIIRSRYIVAASLLLCSHLSMAQDPLFIDTSGKVGIGTTDPKTLLHLSAPTPELTLQSTQRGGGNFMLRSVVANPDNSQNIFQIFDRTANAPRLVIDKDGNVGIGTKSPSAFFDINGTAWVKKTLIVSDSIGIGTHRPKTLLHVISACPEISIESSSQGGRRYTIQSSVSNPSGAKASFQIIDRTVGACRIGIDNDGKTGINTSSPSATLDVNGSMKIGSWADQSATANGYVKMGEIIMAWGTVNYTNNKPIDVWYPTNTNFKEVFSVTTTIYDDINGGGGGGGNAPCKLLYVSNEKFIIGGTQAFSGDNKTKVKWMAIGR